MVLIDRNFEKTLYDLLDYFSDKNNFNEKSGKSYAQEKIYIYYSIHQNKY